MALQPQQQFGNLLQRFNELPVTRKLGLAAVLAAFIAMVFGLGLWTQAPTYKVLFSNLGERDGGAVIAALEQLNVPFKTEAGGAILVPAEQVYDLRFRLAGQGLPKGGAVGFELMDTSKLGMTQFQEQITYQRALEGELARSIQSLAPVESARVHLAIPKPSVFVRDQQSPSASVVVNLYSGRSLDPPQVSAIVHLVSSSVPSLSPEHVTVVDQGGRLLTARADAGMMQGLNSSQLDYARQVEDYYARRVEAIVVPIVGEHNVRAEVRADLDFSLSESTSETYKPNPVADAQAVRSQQTVEDVSGPGTPARGVPGAFSNQPPGPASAPLTAPAGANAGEATAGQGQGGSSRRESTVNYEVDKTIRHVKESMGRIKRLSVAVVVNYRSAADETGQPQAKPLSPEELTQINNLVKEAMGYSQERGDTINVVNAAFTESKEEVVEVPLWKDAQNVSLAKDLLKNLLIFGLAFYLVFGVLRPLLRDLVRPPEALTPEGEALELPPGGEEVVALGEAAGVKRPSAGYEEILSGVKEFSKNNPKMTADIIRQWMAEE